MRLSSLIIILCFSLPGWSEELSIKTNTNAICTDAPVLIQKSPHARLQKVGQGEDTIQVLHVWGTPFEMGKAQGMLLKEQIQDYCKLVLKLMTEDIGGDPAILDTVYEQAKPFIPPYFIEEIKGMAEGAEIDFQTLLRVNLIGEASEWHCSLFGVWGKATESGQLLQLRALDYATHAEIQRYPQITVYHPESGHAFANIGWVGVVGAVTGISSAQMAISEIGDDYDKDNDTFAGIPFPFLLRDVLQFDNTLDEAIARIKKGPRTTSLLFAVGDGKLGEARGFQASRTLCNVFDPENLEPLVDTHPRIPDVVYWGMSWNVPKYDQRLSSMLKKHYGKLTPEITIREILPTVETGNLQVAVYDLTNMILYTANAAANKESGPRNAYERSFVKLNMKELFAEKKPQ